MKPLDSTQNRLLLSAITAFILMGTTAITALAHPLGNFTTNRYSRLTLAQGTVSLLYVVDLAEIPAYQVIQTIDGDNNGEIDDSEQARYLSEQAERERSRLYLALDGESLPLRIVDRSLTFPPGQGGLRTLRLEITLEADLPAERQGQIVYRDENDTGTPGWREVVVQAGEGVTLLASSAPATDRSQMLQVYPEDLLENPPDLRGATIRFRSAAVGSGEQEAASSPKTVAISAEEQDPFADLIAGPLEGPIALTLALFAAFVWGAAHALSPGHGKTIVAAYLIGSRGTARHALFLGLTTTATHTAGVFALGAITLFASQFLLPEQIFPWLSVLSGLLVVGIGLSLVWERLRPLLRRGHHHGADHHHDHPHPDHPHDAGHVHYHAPPGTDGRPVTWHSLLALGVSGGLLPCPSALVVMLGAIALHRIGLGLLLVVVFSLGLASVLTLVGVLMVHAGRLVKHLPEGGRLLRLAPIGSALFITVAGIGITIRALQQMGGLFL